MTYFELLIIAVSLSFDTFAVSMAGGLALGETDIARRGKIALSFAFFQTLFLFIGWCVGEGFIGLIHAYDHWIAFVILAFIGGKMLFSRGDDSSRKIDLLNMKQLATLSVATSIDALAVGISLAMVSLRAEKVIFSLITTAIVTMGSSLLGIYSGSKAKCRLESKASIIGGLVLIVIGFKILIEHLT